MTNKDYLELLASKMYIEMLKNNISRSLEYKRSQGQYTEFAPIGYQNIRDKKNGSDIIADTKQAPIVVKLFNAFATGQYTIKQLTKLAVSLGLSSRQGKSVSESCISNMLKNPFYYGEFCIKGKIYPHKHPKFIEKSLFDTVQTIIKSRKGSK